MPTPSPQASSFMVMIKDSAPRHDPLRSPRVTQISGQSRAQRVRGEQPMNRVSGRLAREGPAWTNVSPCRLRRTGGISALHRQLATRERDHG